MIIVDDCSKDSTIEIVKDKMFKDNRIKLIAHEVNSGPGIARNTALKEANGRYVAFLDSDDLWHPEKLQKQLVFMQKHQIAFSFTSYSRIDEDGYVIGKQISAPSLLTYKDFLKNTAIGCLTVMLDLQKTGNVEMPNIPVRQPMVLWLKLLKKGFIAYGLQDNLAFYRVVNNSISRNKKRAAAYVWKVYREFEGLNVFTASWYFLNYAYNAVAKNIKK